MQSDSLHRCLSYRVSFYQAIITRELWSTSIPLSHSLNAVPLGWLRIRIWWVCVRVGGSACCVGWLFLFRLIRGQLIGAILTGYTGRYRLEEFVEIEYTVESGESKVSWRVRVTPGLCLIRKQQLELTVRHPISRCSCHHGNKGGFGRCFCLFCLVGILLAIFKFPHQMLFWCCNDVKHFHLF